MTRRRFCGSLGASGLLSNTSFKPADLAALIQAPAAGATVRTSAVSTRSSSSRRTVRDSNCRSWIPVSAISDPGRRTARTRVLDHLFIHRRRLPRNPRSSAARTRGLSRGIPHLPDDAGSARARIRPRSRKAALPLRCSAPPPLAVFMSGGQKSRRDRERASRALGIQATALRRQEHRDRAGAPRLSSSPSTCSIGASDGCCSTRIRLRIGSRST